MRLMQVMAGAHHGGAEVFFERLVGALGRAGVDQHVIIRHDTERADRLRSQGQVPVQMTFGGKLDICTRMALRREVEKFDPDVALTWMSRATAMFPASKDVARRPVLCARLGGYYPIKYYRRCDHLIGNTPDIVDYLIGAGWPRARAHYLPNFVPGLRAEPVARGSLGTPEGVPLIVALGRLHRNKAFDVLLSAISELPGVHLWLAGEGPEEQALRRQADLLSIDNRVHFLGWRDDAPELLAAANLLVCPSRVEPLGNVVIEAWAQGAPVVAARASGPAFLITDRATGCLVPIDDAGGLADAIREVISTPALAADLAEAGRDAFDRQFTETAVVAQYRAFFEKVLESERIII